MIEIPKLPSTNHPSVTTEVGRFRLVCIRSRSPKHVVIRLFDYTDDRVGLYEHGAHYVYGKDARGLTPWPLRVRRFHYHDVMQQLIPLLLLDALPAGWRPTLHARPPVAQP